MSSSPKPGGTWSAWFAAAFGTVLGLALIKFGNPIILDKLIDAPRNSLELIFQPWPVRSGLVLLLGCALLALPSLKFQTSAPVWVILIPIGWLGWQMLSAFQTIDHSLTYPTMLHFGACVTCFFLGLFGLGPSGRTKPFWAALLAAFAWMLWVGFEQHYGGLAATREMFYQQPNWQEYPPEYIKKIESNRIFSTLVYPNALAGAILLMLAPLLVMAWQLTARRLTDLTRAVLVGFLLYAALAVLYWSGSKSGWLIGLLLGIAALLKQPIPNRFRSAIVLVVLACGLTGFFVQYAPYFRRGAPSVSARFVYWKAALQIATEHPIVGTGPGTFSVSFRKIKPPGAEMAQLTHNDYLEQAADSGWLGTVAYSIFVLGSLLCLARSRQITGSADRFATWLGLMGWGLQSFVEFLLYIPGVTWTAFALCGWLWGSLLPHKEFDSRKDGC